METKFYPPLVKFSIKSFYDVIEWLIDVAARPKLISQCTLSKKRPKLIRWYFGSFPFLYSFFYSFMLDYVACRQRMISVHVFGSS